MLVLYIYKPIEEAVVEIIEILLFRVWHTFIQSDAITTTTNIIIIIVVIIIVVIVVIVIHLAVRLITSNIVTIPVFRKSDVHMQAADSDQPVAQGAIGRALGQQLR